MCFTLSVSVYIVAGNVTFTDWIYVPELSDKTSTEFQLYAEDFCNKVVDMFVFMSLTLKLLLCFAQGLSYIMVT